MAPALARPISYQQVGLPTTYEDASAEPHGEYSSAPPVFQTPADTMITREQEVTELARQLSRRSSIHQRPASPLNLVRQLTGRSNATVVQDVPPEKLFKYESGSDLDPFSPNFNARKYVKGMAGLSEEAGVQRQAGVSYKNMSVHGFGSDAGK
jgi:ATP-binding cassette subfamily G (WHITE) protein 2 (PDR)